MFMSAGIALCQLLAMIGVFAPIFSPFVYSNLAPTDWHNITPHGNIVLNGFAASEQTPGLMAACGTLFSIALNDLSSFKIGGLHFWISRDGGANWINVSAPPGSGDQCSVGFLWNGNLQASLDTDPHHSLKLWISTDLGKTWESWPGYMMMPIYGKQLEITPMIRRGAYLYGSYDSGDAYDDTALAISADDGAHWTPLGTTPDDLIKQGWKVGDEGLPDYRNDHWWYRTLYADGKGTVLEQSTDDERSWHVLSSLASFFTGQALLATTPSRPGYLCVDHWYGQTDHVSLLSSTDGGVSWSAGATPTGFENTQGETSGWPQMDSKGDCYQGYHFGRGAPPSLEHGSEYVYFRLAPGSHSLQTIPVTMDGEDGNVDDIRTVYVPAGNGYSARLVIQPWIDYRGWAAVFSGLAGETTSGQILWTSIP